jgi:hypothetical protein
MTTTTVSKFCELRDHLIDHAIDFWDTDPSGQPNPEDFDGQIGRFVFYCGDLAWIEYDPDTDQIVIVTSMDFGNGEQSVSQIITPSCVDDMLSQIGFFLRTNLLRVVDDRKKNIDFAMGRGGSDY